MEGTEQEKEAQSQEQETPAFTVKLSDDNATQQAEVEKQEEKQEEQKEESKENKQEEKPAGESKEEKKEEAKSEISDEQVKEYLKAKGLEFENYEDLKPKEQKKLTPEIEKFLEFKDKTGNKNYGDFLATQKDWKEENPDTVIKQLMKAENPSLTEKEIEFRFNKKFGYDENLDEEDVIQDKQIEKKVELQKALNFLDKQKEEYMVPKGSLDADVPEEFKKAKEFAENFARQQEENTKFATSQRNDFVAKTDQIFTDSFEGFKTKIGNEEFVVKPQDLKATKEAQMNIENFQKKFFDEKGTLADPVGYHKALYTAMNADKVAEHFFNLGKASQAESDEKESKNIPADGIRKTAPAGGSGITVKVVAD